MVSILDQIHSDSFQCISCYWYIGRIRSGLGCYAFPKGIPSDIMEGKFDHRNTYPGVAGICIAGGFLVGQAIRN